jgi:serine protease Do
MQLEIFNMSNVWQNINAAAATAVDTVRASLVQIVSDEGSIGAGTIWQSDGLILTNAHVVLGREKRENLQVVLQTGERYPAKLIAADRERDLAALAIDAHDLPTIAIGHSASLHPGAWLMAIGHPWGVLDAITAGIVIANGARLPEISDDRQWIALDMQMRPGHSGGPLFNSSGEIVGVNTMILGPEISFAVPVDEVKTFLKQAMANHPQAQAASHQPQSDSSDVMIV